MFEQESTVLADVVFYETFFLKTLAVPSPVVINTPNGEYVTGVEVFRRSKMGEVSPCEKSKGHVYFEIFNLHNSYQPTRRRKTERSFKFKDGTSQSIYDLQQASYINEDGGRFVSFVIYQRNRAAASVENGEFIFHFTMSTGQVLQLTYNYFYPGRNSGIKHRELHGELMQAFKDVLTNRNDLVYTMSAFFVRYHQEEQFIKMRETSSHHRVSIVKRKKKQEELIRMSEIINSMNSNKRAKQIHEDNSDVTSQISSCSTKVSNDQQSDASLEGDDENDAQEIDESLDTILYPKYCVLEHGAPFYVIVPKPSDGCSIITAFRTLPPVFAEGDEVLNPSITVLPNTGNPFSTLESCTYYEKTFPAIFEDFVAEVDQCKKVEMLVLPFTLCLAGEYTINSSASISFEFQVGGTTWYRVNDITSYPDRDILRYQLSAMYYIGKKHYQEHVFDDLVCMGTQFDRDAYSSNFE